MADEPDKIDELLARLDNLLKRHEIFQAEINQFRTEVSQLKHSSPKTEEKKVEIPPVVVEKVEESPPVIKTEPVTVVTPPLIEKKPPVYQPLPPIPMRKPLIAKKDWEKFIGENLINKIGIVITVIGVAIGAEYAIENNLISPLTRIIFGYIIGLGLLGFAIRLKAKYENFSAVLLSGAMASMYLVTYSAYSFYNMMPQAVAFGVMVLFTIFTVIAALQYNKQVIAHVGLVGAYAVPFMLSNGSDKVAVLFSYIAIINTGILAISLRKYWKPLLYVSFAFTWLIYFAWYAEGYSIHPHLKLGVLFASIFFGIFYTAFLAYKLYRKEKFDPGDVALCLLNSGFYYGIGYALLNDNPTGKQLLGLFTLGNAIIHFIVSFIIYRNKLADRNLFYLVSGLVLVFITIAIPVQLHGHWITLLWAGEAAVLFWIGTSRNVFFYKAFSYSIMILALLSLGQDWIIGYGGYEKSKVGSHITPLLNIHFLSSVLFIAAFSFIAYTASRKREDESGTGKTYQLGIANVVNQVLPAIPVLLIYGAFLMEIMCYWDQLYKDSYFLSKKDSEGSYYLDSNLPIFSGLWCINYTMFFLSLLTLINIRWVKNEIVAYIVVPLSAITVAIFLLIGLPDIADLTEKYLTPPTPNYYPAGVIFIWMRYIGYAFTLSLLWCTYMQVKRLAMKTEQSNTVELYFHVVLLWLAGSELVNRMVMANLVDTDKLGLSILWGCYALLLIVLGIWKKKRHLRIGAIVLFTITLLKLFFYDLQQLDTISKTVVFVSLGILLLIISFLYNKYNKQIAGDSETK